MEYEPLPMNFAADRREVALLARPEAGGAFALTTLTLPPHSADAPLSATTRDALGYYVLSGTLVATVAERTVIVRAGSAVYVAPNTAHTCWNPAAAPAVVLLIAAPPGALP